MIRKAASNRVVGALSMLLPFGVAFGQDSEHVHHKTTSPAPNEAPITITINPEARVSVVLAGALPTPAPCGMPADLAVKIVNQGFLTSKLEAEFVGDVPAGATLEFHPEPLKGVPEEQRTLRITLARPGPTDVSIAFRSHNNAPDLGGRDRVHFLMSCLGPAQQKRR